WFLPFFSIPLFCLISLLLVIFLITEDEKDAEMTFSVYWDNIKTGLKQHSRCLIPVFIIVAILMFILFGFLFYLSSISEDNFDIKGIKKGFLLAIPLLALSITSYVTGKAIKDHLQVMKWLTFIGIVLAGIAVAVISFMTHFIYLLFIFLICGVGIGMALPCLDSLITKSIEQNVR